MIVVSLAVQADGKILAGGHFTGRTASADRRAITSPGLMAPPALADSFDPNADNAVDSIAVQADGKILVGGYFSDSIGGQTRNLFARLNNDTAALQNLGGRRKPPLPGRRGGSSPQFTRVTFEFSTDNVNYTSLGDGTADGSNWTLTGLNLPTGQNLYIRARGYYRSGYYNGSESITESVRNVFLAALRRNAAALEHSTHREHECRAVVGDKLHRLHAGVHHQPQHERLERRIARARCQRHEQRRDQRRQRHDALLPLAQVTCYQSSTCKQRRTIVGLDKNKSAWWTRMAWRWRQFRD